MKRLNTLLLFIFIPCMLLAQEVVETPEYFFQQGINSGVEGNFAQSVEFFSKAIEKRPGFAEAYLYRGIAKNETGDFEGAIRDLNITIELDPAFSDQAHFFRGNSNAGLNRFREAIDDYTLAIYKNPDYLAFFKRGMANFYQKEYHRAIPDFDIAIRLNPDYEEAYLYRGIALYEIGSMPDARKDLERATNAMPENAQAFYYSGLTKSAMQNNYFAIEDFNKALELDPAYTDAYRSRGKSQEIVGNTEKAQADYQLAGKSKETSKPQADAQNAVAPSSQNNQKPEAVQEQKISSPQAQVSGTESSQVNQTALFPPRKTETAKAEENPFTSIQASENKNEAPQVTSQPQTDASPIVNIEAAAKTETFAAPVIETLPGGYYSNTLSNVSLVGFGIQLASYSSSKNIEALSAAYQDQYKQAVFIQVSNSNGRKLYKIIIGNFTNRQAAEELRSHLKTNGFPDCFIVPFEKY